MDYNNIKLVVCDVDGVLTDGGMYVTSNGEHFKKFNAKDGIAVKLLQKHQRIFGIISHSSVKKMIYERANMLNVKYCYVGEENKVMVLKRWSQELNIPLEQVAYIGDDINDVDAMSLVGCSVCPADAVKKIQDMSSIILKKNGGDGCLREFVDMYLELD